MAKIARIRRMVADYFTPDASLTAGALPTDLPAPFAHRRWLRLQELIPSKGAIRSVRSREKLLRLTGRRYFSIKSIHSPTSFADDFQLGCVERKCLS